MMHWHHVRDTLHEGETQHVQDCKGNELALHHKGCDKEACQSWYTGCRYHHTRVHVLLNEVRTNGDKEHGADGDGRDKVLNLGVALWQLEVRLDVRL